MILVSVMNKNEFHLLFLDLLNSYTKDTNNDFSKKRIVKPVYIDTTWKSNNISLKYPNDIQDLIRLSESIEYDENIDYPIDVQLLHKITPSLKKLDSMVGIEKVKENIVYQIIYYLQNLENNNDYLHTVIYGPPGTGKTVLAKCIGQIFKELNILSNGTFKKVTRADLIAGYIGQTAIKTKKVIEEALGGVLFIDEVYSLGHADKVESFSRECIDTLCEMLSNCKNNLMVIVAGYEEEIQNCFFSLNPGLKSRFQWNYTLNKYDTKELFKIFEYKVNHNKWKIDEDYTLKIQSLFQQNHELFEFQGRDMENLFSKVKLCHSRRIFGTSVGKKVLNLEDIKNGIHMFQNQNPKQKKNAFNYAFNMYT
jgi:AAA+ superfamily predicted ATPase